MSDDFWMIVLQVFSDPHNPMTVAMFCNNIPGRRRTQCALSPSSAPA